MFNTKYNGYIYEPVFPSSMLIVQIFNDFLLNNKTDFEAKYSALSKKVNMIRAPRVKGLFVKKFILKKDIWGAKDFISLIDSEDIILSYISQDPNQYNSIANWIENNEEFRLTDNFDDNAHATYYFEGWVKPRYAILIGFSTIKQASITTG